MPIADAQWIERQTLPGKNVRSQRGAAPRWLVAGIEMLVDLTLPTKHEISNDSYVGFRNGLLMREELRYEWTNQWIRSTQKLIELTSMQRDNELVPKARSVHSR